MITQELSELKKYPNWVAFSLIYEAGQSKPRKKPFNPRTGKGAMANNPATWGTFEQAVSFAEQGGLFRDNSGGVGFELGNSPYVVIDIDHVVKPDGTLTDYAREIVDSLNSYTEYSPSGTGLHIWFTLDKPLEEYGTINKNTALDIEIYDTGRYMTITGNIYGEGKPIINASQRIQKILDKYFKKPSEKSINAPQSPLNVEVRRKQGAIFEDLLEIMFNSKNGDEIRRLYNGDITGYPSHSEADLALCNYLAFYTRNDVGEIDRLYRASGLMRPKWDEKRGGKTYGEITIDEAIRETHKGYDPNYKQERTERQAKPELTTVEAAVAENQEAENEAREKFEHEAVAYYLKDFMQAVAKNREGQGIPTGFENLDKILDGGLYPGLYVIGANSSLGKTTFILQIADNVAQSGQGVLIFSLEMARNELIAKTLSRLSLIKSLDSYKSAVYARTTRNVLLGNYRNEHDAEIINQAIREYSQWGQNIHITEGIGDVGLSHITEKVKEWIRFEGKPPVVVIDYLQILAPYSEAEKRTDKQNVDKNITELKRLSRDFETPVLGISSFNRENYSAPVSMASFKESGAIEYSSDVLIGMQYNGYDYQEGETDGARIKRLRGINKAMEQAARECGSQDIQVKVLKNRNGVRGSLLFDFYPAFNYFRAQIEG